MLIKIILVGNGEKNVSSDDDKIKEEAGLTKGVDGRWGYNPEECFKSQEIIPLAEPTGFASALRFVYGDMPVNQEGCSWQTVTDKDLEDIFGTSGVQHNE